MADLPATRLANPRIGLFFGIFTSLLIAVGLMALLLESLGVGTLWLAGLLLGGPIVLYATFAIAVATSNPNDFLAAGRRVPGAVAGTTMALVALGGTGLVSLTGALFLMGSDAFALLIGIPAGVVVAGVLFVPFVRKFGAYTIPSYLGARLDSRLVRIASALAFTVPAGLLIVAELALARRLVTALTAAPPFAAGLICVGIVALCVIAGGIRSIVWSSAAKLIAALIALVLPVTIAALYYSNVPFPQLTSGSMARTILRTEVLRDVPALLASPWLVDIPASGFEPLGRRFLQMFGSIGASAYGFVTLAVLAGIAGMPTVLMRPTTTPSVGASRAAVSWAVVLVVCMVMTITAIAIYVRALVTDQVLGLPADRLPGWFQVWLRQGVAVIDAKGNAPVSLAGLAVQRDEILPGLSHALGLPWGLTAIALAGAIAACFAAAGGHLQTLAASISEDLILGTRAEATRAPTRLVVARSTIVFVIIALFAVSLFASDPLTLFLWALAISAATSFPLLALSILWKRLTAIGALAGLAVGSSIMMLPLIASGVPALVLPPLLTAAVATPLVFLTAVCISFVTPAPSRHALEMLRDMRVPGGETIMDRQRRLQRLKRGD